jgi:hypothetical protein
MEVVDRRPYEPKIITQCAKARIAFQTEYCANLSRLVIMIHLGRFATPADWAEPILFLNHLIEIGFGNSVALPKMIFPRVTMQTPNSFSVTRVMTGFAISA